MLKLMVCSEKLPNFGHRRCPKVTVPVSSLHFEAVIFVSIFFSFSTKFFVREMALAFLIAEESIDDTEISIAVGTFSKHKKSKAFFNSNSNNNN